MSVGRLSALSGEYFDQALETAFRAERFQETIRQSRILLAMSVVLNTLFFVSDWRFYGDPHFWVAIPARAGVVLASLVALFAIQSVKTPRGAQIVLAAWEAAAALGVGFLVTSHSEIAFFVVILLPAIFYLAAPTSFAITAPMGILCSIAMLTGFILPNPNPDTNTGLILAMAMMNSALMLVVSKGNRLRRLEWSATQAERRANAELAASRRMLEKIFMAVPIPLVVTERDNGRLVHANHAAAAYFGALDSVLAANSIRAIYADPSKRDELLRELEKTGHVDGFEIAVALPDGSQRQMLLAASRVELDEKDCVITGGVDITARKEMEGRLAELASRDPLTGVLNRAAFFELAATEIERARRDRAPVSVIMVDLDYFKLINDAFGHAAGDQTLKAFADLCRKHMRGHDLMGRLGGEEFACVLTQSDNMKALLIAERLRHAAQDLQVEGAPQSLRVTISVGVAEVLPGETDIVPALARADLALYGAKSRGRNKVVMADQGACVAEEERPRVRSIASARR